MEDGAFHDDSRRIQRLIKSSLQQLGATAADASLYESMLLDAATVFYEQDPKAAVCAWSAADKYAVGKLQDLIDCSLVKIVNAKSLLYALVASKKLRVAPGSKQLWVHDVIKSIASGQALNDNKQSMTRVWRHEQVQFVIAPICYAKHVVKYLTSIMHVSRYFHLRC
jgi:hypothetical protein